MFTAIFFFIILVLAATEIVNLDYYVSYEKYQALNCSKNNTICTGLSAEAPYCDFFSLLETLAKKNEQQSSVTINFLERTADCGIPSSLLYLENFPIEVLILKTDRQLATIIFSDLDFQLVMPSVLRIESLELQFQNRTQRRSSFYAFIYLAPSSNLTSFIIRDSIISFAEDVEAMGLIQIDEEAPKKFTIEISSSRLAVTYHSFIISTLGNNISLCGALANLDITQKENTTRNIVRGAIKILSSDIFLSGFALASPDSYSFILHRTNLEIIGCTFKNARQLFYACHSCRVFISNSTFTNDFAMNIFSSGILTAIHSNTVILNNFLVFNIKYTYESSQNSGVTYFYLNKRNNFIINKLAVNNITIDSVSGWTCVSLMKFNEDNNILMKALEISNISIQAKETLEFSVFEFKYRTFALVENFSIFYLKLVSSISNIFVIKLSGDNFIEFKNVSIMEIQATGASELFSLINSNFFILTQFLIAIKSYFNMYCLNINTMNKIWILEGSVNNLEEGDTSFMKLNSSNQIIIKRLTAQFTKNLFFLNSENEIIFQESFTYNQLAIINFLEGKNNFILLNKCLMNKASAFLEGDPEHEAAKIWVINSEFKDFNKSFSTKNNSDFILLNNIYRDIQGYTENDLYMRFGNSEKVFISRCFFYSIGKGKALIQFELSSLVRIEICFFYLIESQTALLENVLHFVRMNRNVLILNNTFKANEFYRLNALINIDHLNSKIIIHSNTFDGAGSSGSIIYANYNNSEIEISRNIFTNNSDVAIFFGKNINFSYLYENLFSVGSFFIEIHSNNTSFRIEKQIFLFSSYHSLFLLQNNTNIEIIQCYFNNYGNSGIYKISGGAVRLGSENNWNLSIHFCLFQDNYATLGSAIFLQNAHLLTITRNVFLSSVSKFNGGAIYSNNSMYLLIENCVFINSIAGNNGSDIFFNFGNQYVNIFKSIFLCSNSFLSGGSMGFEDSNKNISVVNCSFVAVSSMKSGVISLGVGNVEIHILLCKFLEGLSYETGTLLFAYKDNQNIFVRDSFISNYYSFKNESLVYAESDNLIRFLDFSVLNCSLGIIFSLSGGNKLDIIAVKIEEFLNIVLVSIGLFKNILYIEYLQLKFLTKDINTNDGFESSLFSIRNTGNFIVIINTKFQYFINFKTIFTVEPGNHVIFQRCVFTNIENSKNFLIIKAPSNSAVFNRDSLLLLNQTLFKNNSFEAEMLYLIYARVELVRSKIYLNSKPSPILIGYYINYSSIMSSIIACYSMGSKGLMVLIESRIYLFQSSLYLASNKDAQGASYYGYQLNSTYFHGESCSFYFSSFVNNLSGLLYSFSDNRTKINFVKNDFTFICGVKSGVLRSEKVSEIEIIMNRIVFIRDLNIINTIHLNISEPNFLRVAENFPTRRRKIQFLNLFHNDDALNQTKISMYAPLLLKFFSKTRKVLLFKSFSMNNELDSYNNSFKLYNILSNKQNDNCYLSIIGLDLYNNTTPLQKTDNLFILNFHNELVELKFSVKDFSYCLINITNTEYSQVARAKIKLRLNSTKFFPDIQMNYEPLLLELSFRECTRGEMFDSETRICVECPKGFTGSEYNSSNNSSFLSYCQKCRDDDAFNCWGGDTLSPKPGFARASLNHRRFLICPNKYACLGDKYFSQDEVYESVALWTPIIGLGLCLEGYTGLLCSECDDNYGITNDYKCERCDTMWYFVSNLTKILLRIIILYASLTTAIGINRSFEERFIEAYVPKMSFFLRAMINHIQVLIMLTSLPFYIPVGLRELFSILMTASAPDLSETFSLACILKKYNVPLPSQYFKLVLIYFFLLVTLLFFGLIEYIRFSRGYNTPRSKITFSNFVKERLLSLILLTFSVAFVDMVKPVTEMVACIDLGDIGEGSNPFRLISQLSIDCTSQEHLKWTLILVFPIGFFSLFVMPILLSLKIRGYQNKKTLFSKESISQYGYFYLGYEPNKYYYDVIVHSRKFIFIIVQVFFFTYPGGSSYYSYVNATLLLLIVTLTFSIIQLYFDPYNKKFFLIVSKCENISFTTLIYSNICGIVWITRGEDLSFVEGVFLIMAVSVANGVFLAYWWWFFLIYLKNEATSLLRNMKKYVGNWISSLLRDSHRRVIFVRENKSKKTSLFAISEGNCQKPIRLEVKNNVNRKTLKSILGSKNTKAEQLESLTETTKKVRLFSEKTSKFDHSFNETEERVLYDNEEIQRRMKEKFQALKTLVYLQQKEINLLRVHIQRMEEKMHKEFKSTLEKTRDDLLRDRAQERVTEVTAQCDIIKMETKNRRGLACINLMVNISNVDKQDFSRVSADFDSPLKGYFIDEVTCPKALQKEEFGMRLMVCLKMTSIIDKMRFPYIKKIYMRSKRVFKMNIDIDLRKILIHENTTATNFTGIIKPFDDSLIIKSLNLESMAKTFPIFMDVSENFNENLKTIHENQKAVVYKLFSNKLSNHIGNIVIKPLENFCFEIHFMFRHAGKKSVLEEVLKKTFRKFSIL